jgi:Flp pilus assembly pilin Flp
MNKNRKNIKGATMTEYVLIVGLIAAGAVLALTSVGTGMSTFFTNLNTTVTNAAGNL